MAKCKTFWPSNGRSANRDLTFIAVIAVTSFCATLVAQDRGGSSISGEIVNSVTGAPALRSGVVVRLAGKERLSASAPAYTDGRFSLNLQPGSYRLEASAAGFQNSIATNLTLAAGERRDDLKIRLVPLCRISGAVSGNDGLPVAGALVEVLAGVSNTRGDKQFRSLQSVNTDSLGEYTVHSLPAGRYLVKASAAVRRDGLAYQARYFPGVAALREASEVSLDDGNLDATLNFQLPLVKQVKLRIHVDRELENWASFQAVSADAPMSRPEALLLNRIDAGEYATMLAPGTWRFAVRLNVGGREQRDIRTIVVQGEEQQLTFTPQPGIDLEGTLIVEGDVFKDPSQIGVTLEAADAISYSGPPLSAHPGRDGHFRLQTVPIGDWKTTIGPLPENAYVKSVHLADHELSGNVLQATHDTSGALRIVVSLNGARLRGYASGSTEVVLLGFRDAATGQCRSAAVEPDGTFHLAGLPPGEYKAYEFDQHNSDVCLDPDLVVSHSTKSARVQVKAGEEVEIVFP